jgi:hypothetical protein
MQVESVIALMHSVSNKFAPHVPYQSIRCYKKICIKFGTVYHKSLPKGYHLDVVEGPSTPHDPESDAGGSLSSWQGHHSR